MATESDELGEILTAIKTDGAPLIRQAHIADIMTKLLQWRDRQVLESQIEILNWALGDKHVMAPSFEDIKDRLATLQNQPGNHHDD